MRRVNNAYGNGPKTVNTPYLRMLLQERDMSCCALRGRVALSRCSILRSPGLLFSCAQYDSAPVCCNSSALCIHGVRQQQARKRSEQVTVLASKSLMSEAFMWTLSFLTSLLKRARGTTAIYLPTIIRTCHDVNENTLVFCAGSSVVASKSSGNSTVSSI